MKREMTNAMTDGCGNAALEWITKPESKDEFLAMWRELVAECQRTREPTLVLMADAVKQGFMTIVGKKDNGDFVFVLTEAGIAVAEAEEAAHQRRKQHRAARRGRR